MYNQRHNEYPNSDNRRERRDRYNTSDSCARHSTKWWISAGFQRVNNWNKGIISENINLRRYQRGNQNPYIEEEQTTQWPKEKVEKDK